MATAAGAMIARARREVDELFFDNNAFSPDRAIEVEPRMNVQQRYLEQLIAEGIVHNSEPGHYWMDLDAWKEARRVRRLWTLRVVLIFLAILVAVIAITQVR
jgi:hypothetical protein